VVYVNSVASSSLYPDPTADIRKAADAGFNVIVLSFYLSDGPSDIVSTWTSMATDAQRQATLDYIHAKGASLLMAAGGPADSPYSLVAADYATTVAEYAVEYGFDGVDFDLANFSPGLTVPAAGLDSAQVISWVSSCLSTARTVLGPDRLLTAAPEGPHFGEVGCTSCWAGSLGGFTAVEKGLGSSVVDYYSVQFYNSGASCYTSEASLFTKSCTAYPKTSVTELVAAGIPQDKIVVGKPMLQSDCPTGHVTPRDLNQWMKQAQKSCGWSAGVMTWQWHGDAVSRSWLEEADPPQPLDDPDNPDVPVSTPKPAAAGGAMGTVLGSAAENAPNPIFITGLVGGTVVLLVMALVGFFIYKKKRPSRASLAWDDWTGAATSSATADKAGPKDAKQPTTMTTTKPVAFNSKEKDEDAIKLSKISLPSSVPQGVPPPPKQPFPLPQPRLQAKATAPAPVSPAMSPALSPRSPPSSESRPTPVIPRPIIPVNPVNPVIRALPNNAGASSKLPTAAPAPPALHPKPVVPSPTEEEEQAGQAEPEVPEPAMLIATNDFTAADSTELSFNQGDLLTVIDASPCNAPGWMLAHLSGQPSKKGLVPGTYF
jgi:chitinase